MKTSRHHKLKPQPLFSCGFFRHCTQSVLSPTAPNPPILPDSSSTLNPSLSPPPPPPSAAAPPPPKKPPITQKPESSSSSSSSTSTSQSFTQWRFPLSTSPHGGSTQPPPPPPTNLQELFHVSEIHLISGSEADKLAALQILERSIVPNPPADPPCPPDLMRALVERLKRNGASAARPVTKILLALSLAEENRRVAVEAGAVGAVVETVGEMESSAAERALAALELMCTVPEGAAEVRAHALAVNVMVAVMARLAGRGREYAISVLGVVYGGGEFGETGPAAPAEEVARAVVLALQGECTARGRRKGAQLLKTLEEFERLDLIVT